MIETKAPATRTRSRTVLAVVVAAVAVGLIITSALVGMRINAALNPEKVTVHGAIALTATTWAGVQATGTTCSGYGGYSDITTGADVTLHSASGTLLAATKLSTGTWNGPAYGTGTCTFGYSFGEIVLPGSDPGDLFTVQIGNEARGSVPYTRQELVTTGAQMRLGS